MLLQLLLHLLLYHLLSARDAPPRKDTGYIIQHTDTCPDVGYYFKRESSPNTIEPGPCYLCFCQEDNTAICWKRDNRRCNVESFHYHGVGKRDTRIRRSPAFTDIFFRDAARDVFQKNSKPECKPYESSFSDDCPPADWCTGCTVCDCDSNGRWDCHLLSFCAEGKGKNKSKGKGRTIVGKRPTKKPKSSTSTSKMTMPSTAKKTQSKKTKANAAPPIKRAGNIKTPLQKRVIKKSVPFKTNMTPGSIWRRPQKKFKIISPSKTEPTKEMIIKRNIATHKPIDIKATKVNLEMEIAQKVMKKIMANLRKSIHSEMMNMSKIASDAVQTNVKKNTRPSKKVGTKPKVKPKKNKRQIQTPPKRQVKHRKPIKMPDERMFDENNFYRHKRDASMVEDISTTVAQGNPDEVANTTAVFSVIPVTSNWLIPNDDNCSHTSVGTRTLPENEYYKYVVGSDEPKVNIDGPMGDKGTTQVNITETVFNLIGTKMSSILPTEKSKSNNIKANKKKNVTEINAEANELKYSKWSHLKILKEKKFNSGFDRHKSLVKIITHANKTIVLEEHKNKVIGKNVERILNSRKYNVVKLLNHPKKKNNNDSSTNIQMVNKKIGSLQNLLNNLMIEFHNNNTKNFPKKNRKFSLLRYLKRIFSKIFKRKKNVDRFSKHNLIETLCENFGPCRINRKDKHLLITKLAEFDKETTKILRTVKIIKGLLKLVELPKTTEEGSGSSKQDFFQNDLHKLKNILKGVYVKDDQALSATQLTQIEYIKRNTQDFIESVSRFASLLNEIIVLLTKHNMNASKNPNPVLRNSFINKNITKDDPFISLRHLLVRYNLIQNSFMQRMYEKLNNFENKMYKEPKVSEVKDLNNNETIENFSRNIIHNLRKLKSLARTLSSSRRKRETVRDDDAIEYLLMMMEYLLKQNHPLDAAPVNDGIDLLIEAIKNAPDIKPIKKKVLEYKPATYSDSTTIASTKSVTSEASLSEDDAPSDSEKTSSEDTMRFKQEYKEDSQKNKMEVNKELVEMIAENDKEPEGKYQFDRRAGIDKLDEMTDIVFYNKIEDNTVRETETGLESTTRMTLEMELSEKLDSQDDINIDRPLAIQTNNLDKPIEKIRKSERKSEVFTGDMEEEVFLPGTLIVTASESPTTISAEFITQAERASTKTRHRNLESYDVDKKSKLEWIEENFGRENEEIAKELEENNTTLPIAETTKYIESKTTDKTDTSSLTREIVDEEDKKTKAKINAEEVMLRKQMDLLNSLDYGTEKAEVYESDSKDANADDRYSNDNFPSYFI